MSAEVGEITAADHAGIGRFANRLTEGLAPWRRRRCRATQCGVDRRVTVGLFSLSTTAHFGREVDAYIGELVVAPDADGRGLGTELVTAA